nr:helix-turn-helix transcriptional regulator [Ruegeria lacuscaerulensis]
MHEFSQTLAEVIEGPADSDALIRAVQYLFPCEAAFAVLNPPSGPPVYLADSYPDSTSKAAVQLYVSKTYLLNPVHNAIRNGISTGVYRMADLAPDNWSATTADVIADDSEEIKFRTPGWPHGLQEACLLVDLPGDVIGEISLARETAPGGIPEEDLEALRHFLPLIRLAFLRVSKNKPARVGRMSPSLGAFGRDVLTAREAEIVQMVLKGHSSLSISLELQITISTVKSHRRNAYAKLGVSTQSQLFRAYVDSCDIGTD